MARFHGAVGFRIPVDNQETGITEDLVVERTYFGKVLEHTRRWQTSDMVTSDLTLGNQIAITANDYAFNHASAISYVRYMGGLWSVTSVRVKGPELVLTLGGVYNGPATNRAPEGLADHCS